MNFKIHRGTKEIGGSCVEVWTENTRILLDFGMPLVEKDGVDFNFSNYKSLSNKELIKKGILPDIEGLYKDSLNLKIDGVLISHAHQDHFGLTNFVHQNVNFYLSKPTHKILEISNIFTQQNTLISKPNYFEREKIFHVGDFTITAYWNDHSAFDAHSFLIEAEGRCIFYTGDFRGHGRKAGAFRWFTHNAPKNIDYLLLEGTNAGKDSKDAKTETEIEDELVAKLAEQGKINLVYTSGQNIDRLVSIYRACIRTNKIMVIDVYIASVLKTLSKFGAIPFPSKDFLNFKVIYTKYITRKLKREGNENYFFQFQHSKITKEEISSQADQIVMVVRPSMMIDLDLIPSFNYGNFIYSMWDGYLDKPDTKAFVDYLVKRNFSITHIHTSGHADVGTLRKMADAIKPKFIVPIHTFNGGEYHKIFSSAILELNDGEIQQV